MRIPIIFFLLLTLLFGASSQRKIIVASYPTIETANHGLETFKEHVNPQLFERQGELGFELKVRPSGASYILVLEPFESYQDAKSIQTLMPSGFSDAFINRYTPPLKEEVQEIQSPVEPVVSRTEEASVFEKSVKVEEPKTLTPEIIEEQKEVKTKQEIIEPIKEVKEDNTSGQEKTAHVIPPKISSVLGIEPPKLEDNHTIHQTPVPSHAKTPKEPLLVKQTPKPEPLLTSLTKFTPLIMVFLALSILVMFILFRRNRVLSKKVYDLTVFNQQKSSTIDTLEMKLNQKESFFNTMIDSLSSPLKTLDTHIQESERFAFDAVNELKNSIHTYANLRGTIHLENEAFDLTSLIESSVKDHAFNAPLTLDIDTKLPRNVMGDATKLLHVFDILIRFVNEHTQATDFYLGFQQIKQKHDYTHIKGLIKTSGEGFEKRVIDLVLHALSAEDSHDIHSKEMVQLTIAKRFLLAMEGSLKLNSQGGKGTGFVFELLLENPQQKEGRKYRLPSKSMMEYSVLIADNNILAIGILRRQLEYFHMDVKPCFSWEQAQTSLNDTFFFLDLCFIQIDLISQEELETLLALKRRRNFSLIFIVNNKNSEGYERAMAVEEAYVLNKPYTQDTLLELLGKIHEAQRPTKLTLNIQ